MRKFFWLKKYIPKNFRSFDDEKSIIITIVHRGVASQDRTLHGLTLFKWHF